MRKMRWLALCTVLLISCMSFAGCNGKEENSAVGSVTETVESTEKETKELIPNAESDFLWHALTAEEVGDSQYVGGVVITGYVGDSDDVVIPKAIDNKPVVAIAEFAFSPYRYDDFRYYGEFEGGFSKQTYPFVKLIENTGILDEYETIFQKMNADENIQEAYHDNRFFAYIRYLLEGEKKAEKLPSEVFNQFESWCQSYTPEQLHFFNGYKEYADEGSPVAVFLLDITNNLRSDDDEKYLDIIRTDVIESMKDYEHVSDLKRVMLPNTIALIGGGAFAYCDSLEKVCIYDVKDDEIPFIDDEVWTDVEGMQNHRFLEGHQFTGCTALKETNFYLDVDDCGSQCYQFCINLETVYIAPAENDALRMAYCVPDSQNLKNVYVSDDCQKISAAVSYKLYDTSACTFHLPSSVTEIGDEVFCQHNNKSGDYYKEGGPEETPCEFDGVEIITPEGSYAEQYAKEHGIKVNGVLHEVVKPTEAPTEPTTEAATEAQDDDSWKEAYVTEITRFESQNLTENSDFGYALYYIDEDDIPELYMLSKTTGVAAICGFYNGQLICVSESGSARDNHFVRCIEYDGIFWTSYSSGAEYSGYTFYEYKDGQVSQFMTMDYNEGTYSYTETGSERIIITEDEFYRMHTEYSQKGFVWDYLLTHAEVVGSIQGEDQSVSTYDEAITGTIITDEDALNVRIGPSTEYAKLGTIPKGATVYITGENGDWYVIEYGTDTGYILKDYVALD